MHSVRFGAFADRRRQFAPGVESTVVILLFVFVFFALLMVSVSGRTAVDQRTHRHLDQVESTENRRRSMKRDVSRQPSPPPPPPASSSSSSSSQCLPPCSGVKHRPVCASDGVTYSSKCELRGVRECEKRELRVVSKGRCPNESKCQEDRRIARFELLQRRNRDIFVPECRGGGGGGGDGGYAETQCHNATGYCWCVRPDGKPIPGSSVEGPNTNCQRKNEGKKSERNSSAGKYRRGVGGCGASGRSTFNQNLIRRFNEEYTRVPRPMQQTTVAPSKTAAAVAGGGPSSDRCQGDDSAAAAAAGGGGGDCVHRRVVEWKFSELDVDGDEQLKQRELKTLSYLVNKIVEPHSCALSFLDHCDRNRDRKISLNEWTKCLRINATANNGEKDKRSSKKRGESTKTHRPLGNGVDSTRVKPRQSRRRLKQQQQQQQQQKRPSHGPKIPLKATFYVKEALDIGKTQSGKFDEREEREDDDDRQRQTSSFGVRLRPCEEERQKAKQLDRTDPEGRIFIPECLSNGQFRSAQCHNATGYCWCVDESTGVPLPGLSTHNVTPDCSDVKTNSLKGCPFVTRKRFLEELLDHITQQMVDRANNGTSVSRLNEPDPNQSIEERAVRWKLTTMDSNHNGILEKGEVKIFREEMKLLKGEEKYTRKCRRNFLQNCDEDNDSNITLTEWVNCLGLNNEQLKSLPENPKRIGKNPFSTVLKS